LGAKLSSVV